MKVKERTFMSTVEWSKAGVIDTGCATGLIVSKTIPEYYGRYIHKGPIESMVHITAGNRVESKEMITMPVQFAHQPPLAGSSKAWIRVRILPDSSTPLLLEEAWIGKTASDPERGILGQYFACHANKPPIKVDRSEKVPRIKNIFLSKNQIEKLQPVMTYEDKRAFERKTCMVDPVNKTGIIYTHDWATQ